VGLRRSLGHTAQPPLGNHAHDRRLHRGAEGRPPFALKPPRAGNLSHAPPDESAGELAVAREPAAVRVANLRVGDLLERARHGSGSMPAMSVRIERDGAVTTVVLARPERRNAIDGATATALADAFRAFDGDPDAKVAVLYGEGGTFSAGADLKALVGGSPCRVAPDGDGPLGPTRMLLSKPVIAAVAGHAVAGGLELALWCDLRVAEEDAVFGVFCRRWGVPFIDGGTVRLPRLIGHSRALDMLLTGRPVRADEALAWGLANRVVEKGRSREAAEALAREIACFPQTCMRKDRQSSYEQWGLPFERAMANEFVRGGESLASGEFAEGAARFAKGAGRHGSFD
jgi:enoyl-CoA hydratase